MISGVGVGGKYNVIIEGRRSEMSANVASPNNGSCTGLEQFIQVIRNSSKDEFEMWYQLYKDIPVRGVRNSDGRNKPI